MAYLSDIEIAQSAKPLHITEIAERAGIDEKYLEQYGRYKAKIDNSLLRELDRKHDGLRYRIFGAIQRGEIDGFKEIAGMQGKKAYRETEEE